MADHLHPLSRLAPTTRGPRRRWDALLIVVTVLAAAALVLAAITDETGAFLAFSGVLAGGALTSVTTDRRHTQQLMQDQVMGDRAFLRELLRTVAEDIENATEAVHHLFVSHSAGDIVAARSMLTRLDRRGRRLNMFVAPEHPLLGAFGKVRRTLRDCFDRAPSLDSSEEAKAEVYRLSSRCGVASAEFEVCSVAVCGVASDLTPALVANVLKAIVEQDRLDAFATPPPA